MMGRRIRTRSAGLRSLPAKAYAFGEWRQAKVHPDHHIEVKRAVAENGSSFVRVRDLFE